MPPDKKTREYYLEHIMKLRDEMILEVNGQLQANPVKTWIQAYPMEFYQFIQRSSIHLTLTGQRRLLKSAMPYLS